MIPQPSPEPPEFIIRRRPIPERLEWLADLLSRQGDDPTIRLAVDVCLRSIADELQTIGAALAAGMENR